MARKETASRPMGVLVGGFMLRYLVIMAALPVVLA